MKRKEEEFEQNGQIVGQQLADELYGHKVTHVASPATALHQTFQGSGFVQHRPGNSSNRSTNTRGIF